MRNPLTMRIDQWNDRFFSGCRARLSVARLSIRQLEWLSLEHFQFSRRNPLLLEHAAEITRELPTVHEELLHNCVQERGHARLYQAGLAELGLKVARRQPFAPTDEFLDCLQELISFSPSQTLGVMYATESAAIFEHSVFREIGRSLAARQGLVTEGRALREFHDLHLEGVEQGHKDGLGVLIDSAELYPAQLAIALSSVSLGARLAIAAMDSWWGAMLSHCGQ